MKFRRTQIALFLCLSLQAWPAIAQDDSVAMDALVRKGINYIQYYNKDALLPFAEKWSGEGKVTMVIFGDSHVQPDIYPGEMRKQLQSIRGAGGFGMVFPYSTAKTYSAIEYFSSHTGAWTFSKSLEFKPKLLLGVSGITSKTTDSLAGFKIKFKKHLPGTYSRLRIYCRQDKKSFDFRVCSGDACRFVEIDSVKGSPISIVLPKMDSAIDFQVVKNKKSQLDFEFYGLSIDDPASKGVVLHAMGVGGSRYGSILEEKLFDSQLLSLAPDLVILDFGTNDILYENKVPPYLEDQIVRVIQKVRKTTPKAVIVLTTAQDMTRKNISITAAEEFADLVRKIARNQHCPFYDWYWVSGGPEKITGWFEGGLAQQDLIHLTLKGYILKGQLMADALIKSMARAASLSSSDSLIFDVDSLKRISHPEKYVVPDSLAVVKPIVEKEVNFVRHKIAKGETLKSIARLYHVSVANLKRTNGLQNSLIVEGNYLDVEIPVAGPRKRPAKIKSAKAAKENYVLHKIAKGETLSEIAEKYKVSVIQIKKLNHMKTSRIKAGHTLKIKPKQASAIGR